MKKTAILTLTGLMLFLLLPAQVTSGFQFVAGIKTNAKLIHTDNLGNLYIVTQTNQLYKYGRNGTLTGTLNYNYTGNISQIDASNPMQIYLFYRELNKVILLDNNLAFRGEVDLNKAGIIQAGAMARAYDNNIWVFDLADLQLKKVNRKNEIEQSSGNIRQYVTGNPYIPNIFDNNDRVFVTDTTNGILVFDLFGSYLKTIPITGISTPKVLDKYLFFYRNGQLNRYNWIAAQQSAYALPDTSRVINISVEKERLYLQKQDSVFIYSY